MMKEFTVGTQCPGKRRRWLPVVAGGVVAIEGAPCEGTARIWSDSGVHEPVKFPLLCFLRKFGMDLSSIGRETQRIPSGYMSILAK